MVRTISVITIILLIALANIGGCNVFQDFAAKNSDAAIMDDATNLINRSLWTDAINKLTLVSPQGQLQQSYIVLKASAYAGRGGLNTISLITSLNNNASGANIPLFLQLMKAFDGATLSSFNDEIVAQNLIFSISTNPAVLTGDQNIFLVFVEFAKLGTLFAATADPNATGSVSASFDNCTTILSQQAAEVVVAISTIISSLGAVGSSIASQALGPIATNCSGVFALSGFCSPTSIANVTNIQIQVALTLIGENNLNIGLQVRPGALRQFEFIAPCPLCGFIPNLCPVP